MFANPHPERDLKVDLLQLLAVLGLMVVSVAFVYSAKFAAESAANMAWYHELFFKQIIWFAVGLGAAVAICLTDYHTLARWSFVAYWISIMTLVAVLIHKIGSTHGGARRWIDLPGFQFQPSEFAKLAFILAQAHFLSRPVEELRQPAIFWKAIGLMVLPFMLIMKEPDLGSALVLVPTGLVMMFVAGTPKQFLLMLGAGAMLVGALLLVDVFFAPPGWWQIKLETYQRDRLLSYFGMNFARANASPAEKVQAMHDQSEKSYQARQALISVGSGGFTGKGWRKADQIALGFLPRGAAHTDFIFSVIAEAAQTLAADPKNLAENLMIVDLLRNDLGRIAVPGSVQVPHLFEVTQFNTVLQMTSTVQAQVRDDISLSTVIQALYPCGSITGAPKHRTMQIIQELEPAPRGLYTGAIGWFDAESAGRQFGDFCLSVPIRTLWLQPAAPQGPHGAAIRRGEMGVGAGIVHDSVATEEYAECALKAKFLTGLQPDFSLFETMYASSSGGCRHLDLHLQRLQESAAYFGFPYDGVALRAALQAHCAAFPTTTPMRLRLSLAADGSCTLQSAELAALATPVSLLIAPLPMQSDDLFLRHKTTVRQHYDQAWQQAQQLGAFDMLFFNQRGELTEGGRSSVFLKLDDRWYTPPLQAGLLPGVMRSVLLNDPAWNAAERSLGMEDLLAAEEIMVCNALRGAMPVTLLQIA